MLRLINASAWCIVVLLCLFCDTSFGNDKERRDIHRIIIREKVNKSRGNHHHYNREREREHPRTQYESYEKGREREVRNKNIKIVFCVLKKY